MIYGTLSFLQTFSSAKTAIIPYIQKCTQSGKSCIYYIYHGFSNLIIIWIKIYFPEEILNVKFGWNNISGKKYVEMAHKILKSEKKML